MTISLVAPHMKGLPPPFCSLFWHHGSSLSVKLSFCLFCVWVPLASSRQQCALLWISNETKTVVAVPEGSDSQWIMQCVSDCVNVCVWSQQLQPVCCLNCEEYIYWSFCKHSQRDRWTLLCVSLCVYQSEMWVDDQLLLKGWDSQCNFCDPQYLRGSTGQSHEEVKESNNKQES